MDFSKDLNFHVHSLKIITQKINSNFVISRSRRVEVVTRILMSTTIHEDSLLLWLYFSVSSLRLGEILALSYFFLYKYSCYKEIEEQHHSFGLYPVTYTFLCRGQILGKFSFLVWSTCYKPFDSESFMLSGQFHIWIIRFRDSVADRWSCLLQKALLLRTFARNQQCIFLPLLTSFSECIHVYRFQFRCSYTVLCIHYKKVSQHWG